MAEETLIEVVDNKKSVAWMKNFHSEPPYMVLDQFLIMTHLNYEGRNQLTAHTFHRLFLFLRLVFFYKDKQFYFVHCIAVLRFIELCIPKG